jgi:hypothetical protein
MATDPNIWLVEHWDAGRWWPTVGIALDHPAGRAELADWKAKNPDDRFRLVRYRRIREAR